MLTYDPATGHVAMNLTSLEHCGFNHDAFDDELFMTRIDDEEARWPKTIMVTWPDREASAATETGEVSQADILRLIRAERARQDEKWGEQHHKHGDWLLILQEEIGEASEAILKWQYEDVATELVQAAAVLVAWLEDYLNPPDIPLGLEKNEGYYDKSLPRWLRIYKGAEPDRG